MRICLVTPFAWSQPHDVNEHVAGVARRAARARARGHRARTVEPRAATSPPGGARSRAARRRRASIALGPAVPISRRSRRSASRSAFARTSRSRSRAGGSTSSTASSPGCRASPTSRCATRDALDRRDVLLAGAARLPAGALAARAAARPARRAARDERGDGARRRPSASPATTGSCRRASTRRCFAPAPKRQLDRARVAPDRAAAAARARCASCASCRTGSWSLLRTTPARSAARRSRATLRGRVQRAHRARRRRARASCCARPRSSCPASTACARVALEARPRRAARSLAPPAVERQPELAAAETARLADDEALRAARAARRRAPSAEAQSFAASPTELEELYDGCSRDAAARAPRADPLADRPWIVADLHMHTSWSHDCSIDADELVDHAEARRARRDRGHRPQRLRRRARGGRLRARPRARRHPRRGGEDGRPGRGDRPLPRARDPTRAGLRRHDRRDPRAGRARLPPPPVRPDARDPRPATLHRHLADIDVLEVYNARLLLRGVQRRGAPLRPQVQPHDGRRLGRARPPGRRHRRAPHARASATRRSSSSRCERREVLRRPKSLAYLQSPEVGGAGQGEGSLEDEPTAAAVHAVTTDEIYQRYLDKAITEINRLHARDRGGRGGRRVRRAADRPSAGGHLPAQVRRRRRRSCRRASRSTAAPGNAIIKSLAAAARRPVARSTARTA